MPLGRTVAQAFQTVDVRAESIDRHEQWHSDKHSNRRPQQCPKETVMKTIFVFNRRHRPMK